MPAKAGILDTLLKPVIPDFAGLTGLFYIPIVLKIQILKLGLIDNY
jgi:hypothetical protein